ncbi:MAG: 3-dehydroquinate dehydratase [Treponema sp.]|nr:MAG: 3-dehydroquinate dehydratase [Treponema sp.]
MSAKICLVLTEDTIEKNLRLIDEYKNYIDIVELRADFLKGDEVLSIRKFPAFVDVPVILTLRRVVDGGFCTSGEGARVTLFARGLSFADSNPKNNFAYVDFEHDFDSSGFEEVAQAFNIKIIRSLHSINEPVKNILQTIQKIRKAPEDIVKLSFKSECLKDVTKIFSSVNNYMKPYIISPTGRFSLPARLLATKIGSEIVYTFSKEHIKKYNLEKEAIDPIELNDVYGFKNLDERTKVFGIIGKDVRHSKSPIIHNEGYRRKNMNAVYIPISVKNAYDALEFAERIGICGLSVTSPFKQDVIPYTSKLSDNAKNVMSVNTLLKQGRNNVIGYNTDIEGLKIALKNFLNRESLKGMKVAIIGAGGVANSVALVVKEMSGSACILNRTIEKAAQLAEKYNFKWAFLDSVALSLLQEFSDLIIQTTTVGSMENPNKDPLDFYAFNGNEKVFDLIYQPKKTVLMQRAERAGCKVCNGYEMLKAQAYLQFNIFTGRDYE